MENLNTLVIYRRILTLENVETAVIYRGIFIALAQDLICYFKFVHDLSLRGMDNWSLKFDVIFTTLYFLHNLQMGPIRQSVGN